MFFTFPASFFFFVSVISISISALYRTSMISIIETCKPCTRFISLVIKSVNIHHPKKGLTIFSLILLLHFKCFRSFALLLKMMNSHGYCIEKKLCSFKYTRRKKFICLLSGKKTEDSNLPQKILHSSANMFGII